MFFFPTLWHLLFLQGLLFFSSSPSSLRRALWKRRRRGKNLRWRSDLSDKFFFGWGDGGSPLEIGPLPSSLFQIRKEGLFFVGGRLEWEIIDLGIPGWFLGFRPRNQSTQTHTSTFFGGSGSLKFAKRELDKLYLFFFLLFRCVWEEEALLPYGTFISSTTNVSQVYSVHVATNNDQLQVQEAGRHKFFSSLQHRWILGNIGQIEISFASFW